jgi:glycosyltransferase involved in cell wall biosynthesis
METFCVRLVEALRPIAEVDVLALPGRPDGAPPSAWSILRFGLTVAIRLLLAKPAAITHIADMASWPLAVFASLRSRSTRLVLSAHGTDVSLPLRHGTIPRLYEMYLKLGARLLPSAVVIANSAATAKTARQFGFTQVTVIPLGADISDTAPSETPTSHILFVGRLAPRKGCGWFVRNVMPLLSPEITLRVAGNVWDQDERDALDDPRVEYLGPVYGEALIREYASALCVIVPTRDFEGFGLTALEAAASGGLVLASDHSGLRQSVVDGTTGFLIETDDVHAWTRKIAEIHAWSPVERRRFIERSLETLEERNSWERVAREMTTVYGTFGGDS